MIKLVEHEHKSWMGHKAVKLKNTQSPHGEFAVLNSYLHEMATRFPVWRRQVESAIETNGIFLVQTPAAVAVLKWLVGDRELTYMTPFEYTKTVNKTQRVYCPIRPTKLSPKILDALLDSPELHVIRSNDHVQERFLKELRQRATERGGPKIEVLLVRDGR